VFIFAKYGKDSTIPLGRPYIIETAVKSLVDLSSIYIFQAWKQRMVTRKREHRRKITHFESFMGKAKITLPDLWSTSKLI